MFYDDVIVVRIVFNVCLHVVDSIKHTHRFDSLNDPIQLAPAAACKECEVGCKVVDRVIVLDEHNSRVIDQY